MEISWLGSPEERIISIGKFRNYIDTLTLDEAIQETLKNWITSPKVKKIKSNIIDTNNWPGPWELFSQNYFDEYEQILGAFYTLILSRQIEFLDYYFTIGEHIIYGVEVDFVKYEDLTNNHNIKKISAREVLNKIKSKKGNK